MYQRALYSELLDKLAESTDVLACRKLRTP